MNRSLNVNSVRALKLATLQHSFAILMAHLSTLQAEHHAIF